MLVHMKNNMLCVSIARAMGIKVNMALLYLDGPFNVYNYDPSNRIGQLFRLLLILQSRLVKELLTEDPNDIFVLTKDLQSL